MDDDTVKSALEIAMERISAMPKLTPEEITEQKEQQYKPIGEALGRRFLQGSIREADLLSELKSDDKEQHRTVRRFCIVTLCGSIQLEDEDAADKAFSGLDVLAGKGNEFCNDIRSEWDPIRNDFERQKEEKYAEFEKIAYEDLHRCGISGSAVRPNLNENESLHMELETLSRAFEPRIERFRSMVAEKLKA